MIESVSHMEDAELRRKSFKLLMCDLLCGLLGLGKALGMAVVVFFLMSIGLALVGSYGSGLNHYGVKVMFTGVIIGLALVGLHALAVPYLEKQASTAVREVMRKEELRDV